MSAALPTAIFRAIDELTVSWCRPTELPAVRIEARAKLERAIAEALELRDIGQHQVDATKYALTGAAISQARRVDRERGEHFGRMAGLLNRTTATEYRALLDAMLFLLRNP